MSPGLPIRRKDPCLSVDNWFQSGTVSRTLDTALESYSAIADVVLTGSIIVKCAALDCANSLKTAIIVI